MKFVYRTFNNQSFESIEIDYPYQILENREFLNKYASDICLNGIKHNLNCHQWKEFVSYGISTWSVIGYIETDIKCTKFELNHNMPSEQEFYKNKHKQFNDLLAGII